MQGFWLTLAWGLGSLFAVSVLVALVEYLRQGAVPPRPVESPRPRALTVDLDVDALPDAPDAPAAAPPAAAPPAEPRVVMTEVLNRLQQARAEAPWVETTPMVLAPREAANSARAEPPASATPQTPA
jgi:hypothetical protein